MAWFAAPPERSRRPGSSASSTRPATDVVADDEQRERDERLAPQPSSIIGRRPTWSDEWPPR